MSKMPTLFAFWKNESTFPYVLGGEVTSMDDAGLVETKEYGPGHRFQPVFMLPVNPGRRLMSKLDALREQERKARREHDAVWRKAARDTVETATPMTIIGKE